MNPNVTDSNTFFVFYYKDFSMHQQTNFFVWFPRFFFPIKKPFFLFLFHQKKFLRVFFSFDTDGKHNFCFLFFYFLNFFPRENKRTTSFFLFL